MNITTYKISDTEYLKINPECIDKDECETCAEIDVDYIDEKNNIHIRFGYEPAHDFYYYLVKAEITQELLDGTRTLDTTILQDVGFEWNELFASRRGPTDSDKYYWMDNSHKKIRPYYSSWLYNDENGNIIFEITPFYPWHNVTKKAHPEKISYKQWIKDYKPVVKTIISKENLKQWIEQATELEKQIRS